MQNLGCNPQFKFAKILNIPETPDSYAKFNNYSWSGLIKKAHSLLINNTSEAIEICPVIVLV